MKRNLSIDLLKVLACFSVVVLHVSGVVVESKSEYTLSHLLYYSACIAVPIFFMVNGYFLINKREINYGYILKKISNILIIVLSWNLLISIATFFVKGRLINPIYAAIMNLMQHGYFWQFWFFGALIIIYLLVPIINKCFKNIKKSIIFTFIMVCVCFSIDLINIFKSIKGESIVQMSVTQTFRLWTWFAYYLLGGLLGNDIIRNKIIKFISVKWNWVILISSLIASNLYQFNMAKIYNSIYAEYFYDNILTFIYVVSLFILVLRYNFERLKTSIMFISSNMIGIYILHVTIIKIISKLIGLEKPFVNTIVICIVFLGALFGSWIISKIPVIKKLISV